MKDQSQSASKELSSQLPQFAQTRPMMGDVDDADRTKVYKRVGYYQFKHKKTEHDMIRRKVMQKYQLPGFPQFSAPYIEENGQPMYTQVNVRVYASNAEVLEAARSQRVLAQHPYDNKLVLFQP